VPKRVGKQIRHTRTNKEREGKATNTKEGGRHERDNLTNLVKFLDSDYKPLCGSKSEMEEKFLKVKEI